MHIVLSVQNRKGDIEQKHRELRQCARNNKQLNVIGVLHVKQGVGEQMAAE